MFPGLVPTLGRIFEIFTEAPRTGTKTYIHAIGSVGRMVSGFLEANGTPQRSGPGFYTGFSHKLALQPDKKNDFTFLGLSFQIHEVGRTGLDGTLLSLLDLTVFGIHLPDFAPCPSPARTFFDFVLSSLDPEL